jgi:signal peptidase I
VIILLVILVIYILMSLSLKKVFEKAGVDGTKALIPGVNFIEMCKLIGQPTSHAAWMLFPIVNIFTYAGMKVDLVRSFGKFNFSDSFWAVVFSPFIFNKIGNDNSKYEGPIVPKEKEYQTLLQEAHKKNDKKVLDKLAKSPYKKGSLREWTEAIVFAVFAAAFIRMFLIEAYVIPSSSMEGSLLIGDYLFVSKAHYGIRTPMTVLQIPLLHNRIPYLDVESYVEKPGFDYHRLPALQNVQRNEPFVFNWPVEDSSYITPTYMFNMDMIRNSPEQLPVSVNEAMQNITVRPVDKRDHYIKRCVGLPNDVIEIKDRQLYVNGTVSPNPEKMQFMYQVGGLNRNNIGTLTEMGVNLMDVGGGKGLNAGLLNLNQAQVDKIKTIAGVTVEHYPLAPISQGLFPFDTLNYKWSNDNYGPLKIPAKGETVNLTPQNISLYMRVIAIYENNKLEIKNNEYFINGSKATSYTFKQNYYWAMGDNRHNSQDSRAWGFVPEDHVVGKPLFIWFSKGEEGIRWDRIFTSAVKK